MDNPDLRTAQPRHWAGNRIAWARAWPHLKRPNVINRRALPTPFKAHSTLLDVFTQGGLLGVIAVCSLFAGTFLLMLRARLDALVALTAALAIFSISHFVLRQPIVWFALALSLILGLRARPLRAHTEH